MKPSRFYRITTRGKRQGAADFIGIVMTPAPVDYQVVVAAWSYAVRYSAKGLDVPDFEAAVKLMIERHPTWILYPENVYDIGYSGRHAEEDKPET